MNIEKLKKHIITLLENELSKKLSYHGVHHTLKVLNVSEQYVDRLKISTSDANLLFTAALLHDTGFISTYDNHEETSILFAKKILPEWNYTEQNIKKIEGMIRATKIPQQANNLLEQILADADLDYLGTNQFYSVGETLYKELLAFEKIQERKQWDEIQVKFLQKHKYHTTFAKENREQVKQIHLKELLDKQSNKTTD